jgi:bacillolysin
MKQINMKTQLYRKLIVLFGILVLLFGVPYLGQAAPPVQEPPPGFAGDAALIDRLSRETDGAVRISYHAETGKVRFIGTSPNRSIAQPSILGVDATTEEAARGFLATYGKLFGLKDPQNELTLMKERTLDKGRAFVRFQQTHQGIPIVGGELIVQTGLGRNVISANGEILPDLNLDVTPTITAQTARQTALAKVAKDYGMNVAELTVSEPELWIYNPILLGAPGPRFSSLVWRMAVTPLALAPINEFVLIDAHLGAVVLHFNQIDTARNRLTYDGGHTTSLPSPGTPPVCNESNPPCSGGDTHEVAAHVFAGDTYDFYSTEHGRDSIDDAGMTLISTVHYDSGYDNAYWDDSLSQVVYGDLSGWPLADDIVGHELTHGVTRNESNLFYFYQSGAINESLSDVWGEFVDQTNLAGDDSPGAKWQIGEDISGKGAIRYMDLPTDPPFFHPDRIRSSNYYCGEVDSGGVHINSGVNNKAAYLMTDGDVFNGYTVTGLGISQVADLYYEVQTNMLTSGSNYNDLYDALIQASINLGFSAADQQEVQDALDAVQMNQRPCGDSPEALICPPGESPTDLFFDDMENISSGNWTSAAIQGANAWQYVIGYATSGVNSLWGFNQPATADFYVAMTSDVALLANTYMHFKHDWAFEDFESTTYDGGVLEYSTDGGSSWNDAGSLFAVNGYNGTISTAGTNPLGGRQAFTAEGHGYTASRLDLSSLTGQNVRFRFRIGTDSNSDVFTWGWFVDDVRIYTCPSQFPPPGTIFLPIILKQ